MLQGSARLSNAKIDPHIAKNNAKRLLKLVWGSEALLSNQKIASAFERPGASGAALTALLERLLGWSLGCLGASWGRLPQLGTPWGLLEAVLGTSWIRLGASWNALGASWRRLGAHWSLERQRATNINLS